MDVGVAITGTRGEGGEEEAHAKGSGKAAKDLADEIDLLDEDE